MCVEHSSGVILMFYLQKYTNPIKTVVFFCCLGADLCIRKTPESPAQWVKS